MYFSEKYHPQGDHSSSDMKSFDLKVIFTAVMYAAIFLLLPGNTFSQTPTAGDCLGATPVCQDIYYEPTIFSGTGAYGNEIPQCNPSNCATCCPNNCLDGEWNSAWYIFTVQQGGQLRFSIQPDVTTDDYDWAVYDMSDNRCEDLYTQVNSMQRSCNAAGISNATGMNSAMGGNSNCNVCGTTNKWNADLTVFQGQQLILYVSNWGAGASGGFTLDFSGSTAVIYDDVPPTIDEVLADEVNGCSETEIDLVFTENVTCDGVTPYLFEIEGPGGPYLITDVFGPACDVGGTWEKEFTLTVDHPFTSNGWYTLYMSSGFPGVHDACNNIAQPDTVLFYLDLGAPEIDESGLAIQNATCGMDNGSITGIMATGQSSLSYVWKNGQGAIVGNLLDLVDIPAGEYTLEVYDLNDCITYAGPFSVAELGAPLIDDSDIVITSSNYGGSNGSIAGIIVNSSYAIDEYIWKDESTTTVGSSLDLTGVPSGYYNLTVIDENTCQAFAGPYFVGEVGGPLSANPSASPEVLCRGESTTLTPGAGGGSGDYEYEWTSSPAGFTSSLENPVVSPIESTTYHVKVFDGFIDISGSVDVIVHQLPIPDAGTDQTIAHGTNTILHGSGTVGSGEYAYTWSPIDKLEDATLQDPQTKNIYETTPFSLMLEDQQTGCISENPDDVIVNITGGILNANPSSFPDSVFCLGETITLHANAGGGAGSYTYTWTSEPPMTLPAEQSFSINIYEAGTYFFYVKVNDGYNDAIGYVELRVDPAPLINLGTSIQLYCIYDTVILDAGNPGASYLWTNGDTNRSIIIGTTGLGPDSQEWGVHVINAEGCSADTSVTIMFDFDPCVGISEYINELDARIYPNPSDGIFNLEIEDVHNTITLKVFDILGHELLQKDLSPTNTGFLKEELNLQDLNRGVYIIKMNTSTAAKVMEIIIN